MPNILFLSYDFLCNQTTHISIITLRRKFHYPLAIDDMGFSNNSVNNGRVSVGDKPKSPGSTRLPIFQYNRIRNLPIVAKILGELICSHHHHKSNNQKSHILAKNKIERRMNQPRVASFDSPPMNIFL